jgi:hypothetical protein
LGETNTTTTKSDEYLLNQVMNSKVGKGFGFCFKWYHHLGRDQKEEGGWKSMPERRAKCGGLRAGIFVCLQDQHRGHFAAAK